MAEAEDIITDAARHATVFAQALWRRQRGAARAPASLSLSDVSQRLDLLATAIFGVPLRLRIAQPPAPPTLLGRLFARDAVPRVRAAVPATDGHFVWLPRDAGARSELAALCYFRCMALAQAARVQRGAALAASKADSPLVRSTYLLLEAHVVDRELARRLPGLAGELAAQRAEALAARPELARFSPVRRPLEQLARRILQLSPGATLPELPAETSPPALLAAARALAHALHAQAGTRADAAGLLFLDAWTGDLRSPSEPAEQAMAARGSDERAPHTRRTGRLARTPEVRKASDDEDDEQVGAWMIQTSQPHEHAEDPHGMQRPADRDTHAPADELADSLSELSEARLVTAPGGANEVMLSDDPVIRQTTRPRTDGPAAAQALCYPEWDHRSQSYRDPGAWVRLLPCEDGPSAWVDRTLRAHATLIHAIRGRFQVLRARRVKLRRQEDGDELDLDAYIEATADLRAGRTSRQALYQSERPARRDVAVLLLVDISGSTDGWVSAQRRVIDVEKEALLLVCIALADLQDPFAVFAFSGQGHDAVTLRTLKRFDEPYGADVSRRIAALEPEAYTRTGAALRHATSVLMKSSARHRLLLLLSDGKPNDVDEYEGRYGVEDTRQAVVEATLQGIHPFCLTIDRQGVDYLSYVFGPTRYALLPRPELLPYALLDWLRHLMSV